MGKKSSIDQWALISDVLKTKSISSNGSKLVRCKTPNQRALDTLRASFSRAHFVKL
jgi:hypothetical protein